MANDPLPILYVVQIGNLTFERFAIEDQQDRVWTGERFDSQFRSLNPQRAVLIFHESKVEDSAPVVEPGTISGQKVTEKVTESLAQKWLQKSLAATHVTARL